MVDQPSDSSAPSASPAEPEKPKGKPWIPVMVARDNAYLVQQGDNYGVPPDRWFMPWCNTSDPRLFVKNGIRMPVHGIVVFKFDGIRECPELARDEARYHEVCRTDFDNRDCIEIGQFDLEAYAKKLNDAYALNKTVPDGVDVLSQLGEAPQAANDSAPQAEEAEQDKNVAQQQP